MDRSNYWARRGLSRRRFVGAAGVGAAGAASLALVGCGDDDDKPASTATTSGGTSTSGSATAAAAEPVRGGTYQAVRADDLAFDHLQLFSSIAGTFAGLVYGGLLTHKPSADPTEANSFVVAPNIATKWEQPDPLTYTLKIQPDIKFQNKPPVNGRKLTMDDILKSYDKFITEPKNSYKSQFDVVDGAPKALDETTLQFKTKEPFAPFITALMAYRQFFFIWPKELLENDALRTSNPVGAGAFMFNSMKAGSYWEFVRNPDFYGKDAANRQTPFIDTFRYNVVPEPANQLAQFLQGNIDTLNTSVDNIDQVKSQVKGVTAIKLPSAAKPNIIPQMRSGPFTDPRLRQAAAMAIKRDDIIAAISKGEGGWNNYVGFAEGKWYLDPKGPNAGKGGDYMKYNQAEAKKLIDAAGFTGEVEFSYPNNGYGEPFGQIMTLIIDHLKQVGFKIKPVTLDYRTTYIGPGGKGAFFGDFNGFLAGYQPTYPHAYLNFSNILKTKGPHNSGGASDQKLDSMIADLGKEFNTDQAYNKSYDIQRYALEQLYMIPTAGGVSYVCYQPNVKNFGINAAYSIEDVKYVWKTKA